MAVYRTCGSQARRRRGVANRVGVVGQGTLQLSIGDRGHVGFAFAECESLQCLTVDFAITDVDRNRHRIAEMAFVKSDDVGDSLGKSGGRVGNACVVDNVDDQALTVAGIRNPEDTTGTSAASPGSRRIGVAAADVAVPCLKNGFRSGVRNCGRRPCGTGYRRELIVLERGGRLNSTENLPTAVDMGVGRRKF